MVEPQPNPPIQRPPAVLNNVINLPPQPANPPTANDIWSATSYEIQVIDAFMQKKVAVNDLAAAVKYKATVVGKANQDAAPEWFQAALEKSLRTALEPIDKKLEQLAERLTAVETRLDTIGARQTDTHKISMLLLNGRRGIGKAVPFGEVPFESGLFPCSAPLSLPLLSSVDVVRGLRRNDLKRYFEGYYPGVALPDRPEDRQEAILLGIGCLHRE